jgi:AcrR family transcriptional regulator
MTASVDGLAEARRTTIMESAERLVAIHGFDALRLRDVAQDAGVSIGLIQHYFRTRDDLLLHTMREASRRRVAEWAAAASATHDGAGRLTALLTGAISDPHRCMVWLETCAAASRHRELRADVLATQDAWRSVLRSTIAEGVDAGLLVPAIDLSDAVEVLVSLIDGIMLATAAEGAEATHRADRTRILLETADRLLQRPNPRSSP